jgi:predicted amidohydrolase YtcJ
VGSLTPGRLADRAILDADPFTVATESLPDVSVTGTWVDGRPAWTGETGVIDVGRVQA